MAQVHVRQQFSAGEDVELYRRVGDWWNGSNGDPVASEKADDSGSVSFDGLEDAAPFWAVQGDKALRVTAKVFTEAAKAGRDVPAADVAAQSRPEPSRPMREGAIDTASAKPTRETAKPAETPVGGEAKAESGSDDDEAAKRGAASKKAAATRKRNAAKKTSSGRKSAGKRK